MPALPEPLAPPLYHRGDHQQPVTTCRTMKPATADSSLSCCGTRGAPLRRGWPRNGRTLWAEALAMYHAGRRANLPRNAVRDAAAGNRGAPRPRRACSKTALDGLAWTSGPDKLSTIVGVDRRCRMRNATPQNRVARRAAQLPDGPPRRTRKESAYGCAEKGDR